GPENCTSQTATKARNPKRRVMAASTVDVCSSIELHARRYHDRSLVLRFFGDNVAKILGRFDFAVAPSPPRLEIKSGDFKPSLIAASSLSTPRMAFRRGRGGEGD